MPAVGAAAIALLVIGAGAAVGIATTHSSHRSGSAGPAATSSTTIQGASSAPATTSGPSSTAPAGSASTTTTTTRSAAVPVVGSNSGGSTGTSGGSAAGTSGAPTPPASVASGSSSGASAPGPTSAEAPTGTYTYATSGSSTIFGNTTSYPPTTTIVISKQGCGESSKWNSSPGNSTTIYACPVTAGIHVVSETSTVSQGSYHNTQTFTCAANAFVPTSGTPGQTWTWQCSSSNGETTTQVVKLIGPESMTVGGHAVATEHVTIDSTLSGPEKGSVTTDYWITSDAVAVKEVGAIDASEFGVSYKSNYTLQLDSLTPAQ